LRERGQRGRVGGLPLPHAPLAAGGCAGGGFGGAGGDGEEHHEAAEEDGHGDGVEQQSAREGGEETVTLPLASTCRCVK